MTFSLEIKNPQTEIQIEKSIVKLADTEDKIKPVLLSKKFYDDPSKHISKYQHVFNRGYTVVKETKNNKSEPLLIAIYKGKLVSIIELELNDKNLEYKDSLVKLKNQLLTYQWHVTTYLHDFTHEDSLYIVHEYHPVDLSYFIVLCPHMPLSLIKRFFASILRAVYACAALGYPIKTLSMKNIVLTKTLVPRLASTDFIPLISSDESKYHQSNRGLTIRQLMDNLALILQELIEQKLIMDTSNLQFLKMDLKNSWGIQDKYEVRKLTNMLHDLAWHIKTSSV